MFVLDSRSRALGSILGLATGDALGAPHEFLPPLEKNIELSMSGGNGWEPGEWTDDTSMAIAILEACQHGEVVGTRAFYQYLLSRWAAWAVTARDVGIQTRAVLSQLNEFTDTEAFAVAENFHMQTGRSAGNGSLMRTAPIALLPGAEESVVLAARQVSKLTHFDDDAGDACVIWTAAIRRVIKDGELDIFGAVQLIPEERRDVWTNRILEAYSREPQDFPNNGWVVSAFQAALSAVRLGAQDAIVGLEAAVRCGNDTDTVAAIAGSLLGAIHGSEAFPREWTDPLHGWPGIRREELLELATGVLATS